MTPGARRAGQRALALLAAGLASHCTRAAVERPAVDVAWTISPAAPVVGPSTLTITLRTPTGEPMTGATVHLEAHMSHPGMAPVVADASQRRSGVYEIPFAFTMPGDWVLLVSVTLPAGATVERRITVANVRPSG